MDRPQIAGVRVSTAVRNYLDAVAAQPCVACGREPVEVAHVRAGVSRKSGQRVGRRVGIAELAVIPLCPSCHRTSQTSIHNLGETEFARRFLGGDTGIHDYVVTLLAEWVLLRGNAL